VDEQRDGLILIVEDDEATKGFWLTISCRIRHAPRPDRRLAG
jgi:hypothetical protein